MGQLWSRAETRREERARSQKRDRTGARRQVARRQLRFEAAEVRLMLSGGPQLISIIPNDGSLLLANETVHTAPTQLTFRFLMGAGESLDPATLAGIQLTRSGGDGIFGNANDVPIVPGYLAIDPAHPNQVLMRFSSPLPDDLYQIEIVGTGPQALKDTAGNDFTVSGTPQNYFQDFRLQLGPQVLSVVPQPVARDANGNLEPKTNEIDAYFNEPLATLPGDATHLDPNQFELISTNNSASTADDKVYVADPTVTSVTPETVTTSTGTQTVYHVPGSVLYDALNNEASIVFQNAGTPISINSLGTGAFRLRIGNKELPLPAPTTPTPYPGDALGTFAGADPLGALTPQTQIFSGDLSPQAINPSLVFPGGLNDPGHRDIPLGEENHATGTTPGGAKVVYYYFPDVYGTDPITGAALHNQITANEEQTVREIFQLYSYYTGITAYQEPNFGIPIFVGDLRALDPTIPPNAAAGLGGPGGVGINGNINWGSALYGSGFMSVTMHEIGHALGLPHDDDGPPGTIMNGGAESSQPSTGPAPPPLFPGIADITNLQFGNEPNSNQIDLYKFTLNSGGSLSAETMAQRLGSSLDTLLTLYEQFTDLNVPASGALVTAGDTFTITDNTGKSAIFEFTNLPVTAGSTLTDGHIAVPFTAASRQQDLAVNMVTAIQSAGLKNLTATLGSSFVQLGGPINVATTGKSVSVSQTQSLIARNDNYYGKDSLISMDLSAGVYYVAVTSTGNDQFDPNVPFSGWGGQSFGNYQLLLGFQPNTNVPLTDPGLSLYVPANPLATIPDKYSFTLTDNTTTGGAPSLNPIVPTAGGSLAAGTYYYEVTAVNSQGYETIVSNEQSATATAADATLPLTWGASTLTGLAGYKVYRGLSPGGENVLVASLPATTTSFNDDGTETPVSATPPGTARTVTFTFYTPGNIAPANTPGQYNIQLLSTDTQKSVTDELIGVIQAAITWAGFNSTNYILTDIGDGRLEIGGAASTSVAVNTTGALAGSPLVAWGDTTPDPLVGNSGPGGTGAYNFWFNVDPTTVYVDKTPTARSAVQQVGYYATAAVTGGSFSLSLQGQTTPLLPYNATAAQVKSALAALPNIGTGNLAVAAATTGPDGFTWQVTFLNALVTQAMPQITTSASLITVAGGGTATDAGARLVPSTGEPVYQTIQSALSDPAVTGAAANGQLVNVRVVGNADASLGITLNQTGGAGQIKLGDTFQVAAGTFTGTFEFINPATHPLATPGSIVGGGDSNFAVLLPSGASANEIAFEIEQALNSAVLNLFNGGTATLTGADGGDVTATDGGSDGKYYYVNLYQGQSPLTVNAQTTPFNARLSGVTQPALYNNLPYLVGTDQFGNPLPDNSPGSNILQLPKNTVLMIDAGAVFKLDKANIEAGSSAVNIDDSQSALQVLGVPGEQATFTSYNDDTIGTVQVHPGVTVAAGDWGGLVFNNDSDLGTLGIFLNSVDEAKLNYGGGQVTVNGALAAYDAIYLNTSRPAIADNLILNSASAAISANPNSFESTIFGSDRTITVTGAPVDGQTFQIGNTTFQFYSASPPLGQGNVAVPFAGMTPAQVATSIKNVLNQTLFAGMVDQAQAVGSTVTLPSALAFGPGTTTLTSAADSFSLDYQRFGPDVHGNTLAVGDVLHENADGSWNAVAAIQNKTNGLFIRIATNAGSSLDTLDVSAVFAATDITYILQENLEIQNDLGFTAADGTITQNIAGQLLIEPGVLVKLGGARIEAEMGSNLIAEGTAANPITFTSLFDNRYGGGGSFDTPDNLGSLTAAPGDWGGLYFWPTSSGSLDHVLITYGGGTTAIEGGFDQFNAVEIHQARVRIADSTLENNAAGLASTDRNGREGNDATTIFVLGAQPVIVNNVIQNNAGSAISVDVDSLNSNLNPDWGRSTGPIDAFTQFANNYGPLVRLNEIGGNAINGMVVRGGTLETSSIWDETDIVYVLDGTVTVPNFASVGGLRLESSPTESLVIKALPGSGLIASGTPLDIADRIGGEIQVLGTPQHPVVMTSLNDNSVGAGLTPTEQPDNNTNGASNPPAPAPGDWGTNDPVAPNSSGGIIFDQYSNDANVAMVNQTTAGPTPATAQSLGTLAPNEQSGDDNSRLGFQVNGFIGPQEVDTYTFKATAGTQVWIDATNTSSALDGVLELIDANGNVLARSDNSGAEQQNADSAGNPLVAGSMLTNPAMGDGGFAGNLAQPLQGSVYGTAGMNFWSTNPYDPGFRVVLPGNPGVNNYYVRFYAKGQTAADAYVPGNGAAGGQYQLQIRLQEQVQIPGSTVQYADIRYATTGIDVEGLPDHSPLVTNATSETQSHNILGGAQPLGNLLTSDTNSLGVGGDLTAPDNVDWYSFQLTYAEIQAIAGVNGGPKTWSTVFDVGYADGLTRPDTVIDVYDSNGNLIYTGNNSDVADQQPQPNTGVDTSNLTHSSFGTLDPFIGPVQLPTGVPNSGTFTYYVAIHSNATLPQVLDGYFNPNSTNFLVRLEPSDSVNRIVEDHVGTEGGQTAQSVSTLTPLWGSTPPGDTANSAPTATVAQLNSYATPYNLSDVVLYVNTPGKAGHLETVNPFSGVAETDQGQISNEVNGFNTIAMRNDGELYGLTTGTNDGNSGQYVQIDTGTAAGTVDGGDGIATLANNNTATTQPSTVSYNVGVQMNAMAFIQPNQNAGSSTSTVDQSRQLYAIGSLAPSSNPKVSSPGFINGLYDLNPDSGAVVPTNNGGINFVLNPNFPPTQPQPVIVTLGGSPLASEITGMAWINGVMYAVDQAGDLLEFNGLAALRAGDATMVAPAIGGQNWQGLTAGPPDVENGKYANVLFSMSGGSLFAFDTSGNLQNIFSADNGTTYTSSVALGISSAASLAFSTLDYNLFHVTNNRGGDISNNGAPTADAGHGIPFAPDQSRSPKGSTAVTNNPVTNGGTSFYFGLEDPGNKNTISPQPGAANYITNTAIAHGWQNEAGGGTYMPDYNVPGGAYGSLSTNNFSLANYTAADKPTLYFNYFLNTQDAQSSETKLQQMFDSARLLVSEDGGNTWNLLATNNNYQPSAFGKPEAERPYYQSQNAETGSVDSGLGGLQVVQPLFDSISTNTGWRQARIDLSDYAGQNSLEFRFDFSTAGTTLNPSDLSINAVTGAANPYANQNVYGNQFGTFQNKGAEERGRDNNFEGWYIDDIVVGLAGRGEMVTNPNVVTSGTGGLSGYNPLPVNPEPGHIQEVLTGPYQLEIRRGSAFGDSFSPFVPFIDLYNSFDVNYRFADAYSLTVPAGSGLAVGDLFTINDGVRSVTFEFVNSLGQTAAGDAGIVFSAADTAQTVADDVVAAIDGNPTLTGVSASDVPNGGQGVSDPATNVVNLFGVQELSLTPLSSGKLAVSLANPSVTESSTNNVGTITRSGNLAAATVSLAAYDVATGQPSNNVTGYPTSISFGLGQTSATFTYNGVVNGSPEYADGTQTVEFVASATNDLSVPGTVDVTDDPGVLPQFSITGLPKQVTENGSAVQGTVTVNTGPVDGNLSVNLTSLFPAAALLEATPAGPAAAQLTITIPVGGTSANFYVAPQDDNVANRQPNPFRIAQITATAGGFISGSATLQVNDDSDGTIPYGVATWQPIGPAPILGGQTAGRLNVSGRITGIAADPKNADVVYIAAAGGGVWKTTDATSAAPTWTPLTDNLTDSSGNPIPMFMGAIALAPSNDQVIYAGTGESNNSVDSFYGEGILVSKDAGTTWTLENANGAFSGRTVAKIAVDPTNANIAYAAVDDFAVNGQFGNTGIWKTSDGGATWTNETAANGLPTFDEWSDVVIDPHTPSTLYAADGTLFGSSANGVYKSTDSGITWTLLSGSGTVNGTQDGRIMLAVYDNGTTNELFESIASPSTFALYKMLESTDGGNTFSDLTANVSNYLGGQGWYDTTLAIDPNDPSYIYAAGQMSSQGPTFAGSPLESFDGGKTWTGIATDSAGNGPHTDAHAVAFDANGNLFDGDDGGIFELSNPTSSTTQSWSSLNTNLQITQFTGIAVDPTNANIVFGGSQDNGTEKYTGTSAWNLADFGDGGMVRIDPTNADVVYHTYAGFSLVVSTDGGLTWTDITPGIVANFANFYAPFTLDSSGNVYYGSDNLNLSTNHGASWTQIGAPGKNNFNPNDAAIDAVAVSSVNNNVVYVSAGGHMFVTKNAQAGAANVTWTQIDLPGGLSTSGSGDFAQDAIAVDPSDATGGTAYAVVPTFTGGGNHVFKTTNFGATWTDISAGLINSPCNVVAVSSDGKTIYVGTDVGVYSTSNGGTTWAVLGAGLPNVKVTDLEYVANLKILAAGTHGRGAFLLTPNTAGSTLAVTLNGPPQVTDDAGTLANELTITRTGKVGPLTVTLTSSDPTTATVQSTVVIPDGQTSVTVPVTVLDDQLAEYPTTVVLTATSGTTESISATLDVLPDGQTEPNSAADNDTPALSLSIPNTTMLPGTPSGTLTATVTRNTPTTYPLVVSLLSLDPTVATLEQPTVTIAAGQSSATFTINGVGQLTTSTTTLFGSIVAAANGFASASGAVSTQSTDDLTQYNGDFNLNGTPAVLGDVTKPRPQGEIIIADNQISNSATDGILAEGVPYPSATPSSTSAPVTPYPGGAVNTPVLNSADLATGVVVENNLVYGVAAGSGFGGAGIAIGGTVPPGGGMVGVVPFARVVNNTIYGQDKPGGTGISVTNSASPTILNNLLVNLQTGISIDALSQQLSSPPVLGENMFVNDTANASDGGIGLGSFALTSSAAASTTFRNPSTNPSTQNFYLTNNSPAIDSSINSLQDRVAMTSVTAPLGIPPSPIIAPAYDLYGQLRVADPNVPHNSGLGSNVFIDRGAIEHADNIGPTATLLQPALNDPANLSTTLNTVFLRGVSLSEFTIQLSDGAGSGVLDSSAASASRVDVREDGRLLTPGIDYTYAYDNNNHVIRLIALSGVWLNGHQYDIYLDNGNKFDPFNPAATPVGITDRAGNFLQANAADGYTHFRLLLANVTNTAPVIQTPTVPPIYEHTSTTFSVSGGDPITVFDVDSNGGSETITIAASTGTLALTNTGLVQLQSLGIDTTKIGNGTGTITITAPLGDPTTVPATPGIDTALDGLTFTPAVNFDGAAQITITVNDNGNSPPPAQTSTVTVPVSVIAVNDPPANTVPAGPLTTNQDLPFTFSGPNAITVSDTDVNTPALQAALYQEQITSTEGTLTLADTAGLLPVGSATSIGNGTSSLSFVGALTNINTALATLTFTPSLKFASGAAGVGNRIGLAGATVTATAGSLLSVASLGKEIDIAPTATGTLINGQTFTLAVAVANGTTLTAKFEFDSDNHATANIPIAVNPADTPYQLTLEATSAIDRALFSTSTIIGPLAADIGATPALQFTNVTAAVSGSLLSTDPTGATVSIAAAATGLAIDHQTITLSFGSPTTTFEFVANGEATSAPGNVAIPVNGGDNATTLALTAEQTIAALFPTGKNAPTVQVVGATAGFTLASGATAAVSTPLISTSAGGTQVNFAKTALGSGVNKQTLTLSVPNVLGGTLSMVFEFDSDGHATSNIPIPVAPGDGPAQLAVDAARAINAALSATLQIDFVASDTSAATVTILTDDQGTNGVGPAPIYAPPPVPLSDEEMMPITVVAQNYAPTLNTTAAVSFASTSEDATAPSGSTVLGMLTSAAPSPANVIALNEPPVENPQFGIAVTGVTETTNGTWQYELSGSTTWNNLPAVSTSAALLLDGNDLVRFVPNPGYADGGAGTPTLSFIAWDETFDLVTGIVDAHGTQVNLGLTGTGGSTPFSAGPAATATLQVVPINDAPTLNATAAISLLPIYEHTTAATDPGTSVLAVLTSAAPSPTNVVTLNAPENPSYGIAVIAATIPTGGPQPSNGTWQYELAGGGGWQNFPAVSASTALLLDGQDLIRFVPTGDFNSDAPVWGGAPTISFVAWDETFDVFTGGLHADGSTVNLNTTGTGGSEPFSSLTSPAAATEHVIAVNTPPTISATASTLAISSALVSLPPPAPVFQTNTLPTVVADDVDIDEGEGNGQVQVTIASTEAGLTAGQNNPGGTITVGNDPSVTVAGNASDQVTLTGPLANVNNLLKNVQFQVDQNFNGSGTITYTVSDLGNFGVLAATHQPGALTASTSITVTGAPVHHAPVLTSGSPTFPSILENPPDTNPAGSTISAMLATPGTGFLTVDTAAGGQQGIAVTGLTGTSTGTWEYSADNGNTWTNISGVALTSALLLPANDEIRYVPINDFVGSATLTFYAWDQTKGSPGDTPNLSGPFATGGLTAFSQTIATATLQVLLVNQAPTFVLNPSPHTSEDNTVTASGGSSGGTNSRLVVIPAEATTISAGQPYQDSIGQTVTFSVSNDNNGLFLVQPAIVGIGANDPVLSKYPTLGLQPGDMVFQLKPDVFGVAHLTVSAFNNGSTANGGATASAANTSSTLTVFQIDDPPDISGVPTSPVVLPEDAGQQAFNLTKIDAGLDQAGETITIAATSDNTALIPNPTINYTSPNPTGTLTLVPQPDVFGTANITVTVTNNGDTTHGGTNQVVLTFPVTVNFVNDAPAFHAANPPASNEQAGPQTVANWATFSPDGNFDANGKPDPAPDEATQTATYFVTNVSNPALFSAPPSVAPNGTLTYTAAQFASGTSTFNVQVQDSGGTANGGVNLSSIQTFTITVNFVNQPPTFTLGPSQSISENTTAQSVPNFVTNISPGGGANQANETVQFLVTNDNNSLFAVPPAISPNGTLTYTPAPNASGAATVTVRAKNNGGTANGGNDTSAPQTFTIAVNFVDATPSFSHTGPNQFLNEEATPKPQSVAGWAGTATAGPGPIEAQDTLQYLLAAANPALFSVQPAIDVATGTLTFTPAALKFGSTNVSVVLEAIGPASNPGTAESQPVNFTITIYPVNFPPTVQNTLPNLTLNENGASPAPIDVSQVFTDPDDKFTVSYADSNPSLIGAALNGNLLSLSLLPNQFGTATITLTATDTTNLSASTSFTVTVNQVNVAPSFTAGPNETAYDNAGTVTIPGWATAISAGPPNQANETLAFNVSVPQAQQSLFSTLPSIDPKTGTLSFAPAAGAFGTATVSVELQSSGSTANGGSNTSPTQTFTITINSLPSAANLSYELSVGPSSTSTSVTGLLAGGSDADGAPLTAQIVTQPANGAVTLNPDGSFTYTKGASFAGLDSFTYQVSDGTVLSNVATVSITSYEATIVTKLYNQVLHRPPDNAGLEFWVTQIQNGQPYSAIAQGIFESNERLDPIIEGYYEQFLLRPADPAGLAYWRDQVWKVYGGPERVVAGMISSPEFFASAGSTNSGWVTQLYVRLLGRQPESTGLSYWTGQLDSGAMTRYEVVLNGFESSPEYYRNLVTGFFNQYLNRAPTSQELATYVAEFQAGESQAQVQDNLIDLPEYRNTPAPPAPGTIKLL